MASVKFEKVSGECKRVRCVDFKNASGECRVFDRASGEYRV